MACELKETLRFLCTEWCATLVMRDAQSIGNCLDVTVEYGDALCVCACRHRISLTLSSNVLERPTVLSRSGAEPSRKPKFEELAGTREPFLEVCFASSNVRALAMKTKGRKGCRHLGQDKSGKLGTQENQAHARKGNVLSPNGTPRHPLPPQLSSSLRPPGDALVCQSGSIIFRSI